MRPAAARCGRSQAGRLPAVLGVAFGILLWPAAASDADWPEPVETLSREPAGRALLAARRRLFVSIGAIGSTLNEVNKDADNFVKETADFVGNSATITLSGVQASFGKATGLIDTAVQECSKLLAATSDFGDTMYNIYKDFSPLENVFASQHGIVALVANKDRMKTLVGVVKDLFDTSDDVFMISTAAGQASEIFSKLFTAFDSELQKLGGRRLGDGRRLLDASGLLDGLKFEEINKTMAGVAAEVEKAGETLKDVQVTLEPLVNELEVKLHSRRLEEETGGINVQEDHAKYSDAIGKIVPTWQHLEKKTIEVCEGTHEAVSEVQSLQCRVDGFLKYTSLPGTDQLSGMTGDCDKEAAESTGSSSCPDTAHSENIRNSLGDSAFFIGVVCLGAEYAITYNAATRIIFALFFFMIPGAIVATCGYRFKDVEFWIEGFLGGFVFFSALFSAMIVWTGMCVEGQAGILCDWRFLLVTVIILSLIWAFAVVRGEKCMLFFAGFDLGAILGGIIYLMYEYERIFEAVIDPDLAKKEIGLLLTVAIVSGLVLGGIAVAMEKPAIIVGTAAVGAALIVIAILILCPLVGWGHSPGWVDLPIFLVFFAGGVVVQYFVTDPKDGKDEALNGEEDTAKQPLD